MGSYQEPGIVEIKLFFKVKVGWAPFGRVMLLTEASGLVCDQVVELLS